MALGLPLLRRPSAAAGEAGWVGLGVYGITLAVMLSVGRLPPSGDNIGLVSRYSAAAMLATCALLVLVVVRRPSWSTVRVCALTVTTGVVTYALGAPIVGIVQGSYSALGVGAVAMRVNAVASMKELQIQSAVVPAAKALGTYPFTDDFTLGCRGPELGSRVDLNSTARLGAPGGPATSVGVVDSPVVRGDTLLSGWAFVNGRQPDCVLVIDSSGIVVGGGTVGIGRADAQLAVPNGEGQPGWRAVAAPNAKDPVVAVSSAGVLYRLGH